MILHIVMVGMMARFYDDEIVIAILRPVMGAYDDAQDNPALVYLGPCGTFLRTIEMVKPRCLL